MRALVPALVFLLGSCATTAVRPDPSVDVSGRWTVVAVNGKPTGAGRGFKLELLPTYGSAQFGCNSGSGSYTVRDGWLVTGNWIITVAGCRNDRITELERQGFAILGKPLAIQRSPAGVRLSNAVGTIDLRPRAPVTDAEIAGAWVVVSINGVGTPGGERFRVTFTPGRFKGSFGCNTFDGITAPDEQGLRLSPARNTEMACELTGPNAPVVPVMHLEEWASAILRARPEVVPRSDRAIDIVSDKGRISLIRAR